MNSKFEPVYLQDAKRHIDWLYNKIKETNSNDKIKQKVKFSFVSKILTWLKRVF
jgi:hypothetical protein